MRSNRHRFGLEIVTSSTCKTDISQGEQLRQFSAAGTAAGELPAPSCLRRAAVGATTERSRGHVEFLCSELGTHGTPEAAASDGVGNDGEVERHRAPAPGRRLPWIGGAGAAPVRSGDGKERATQESAVADPKKQRDETSEQERARTRMQRR